MQQQPLERASITPIFRELAIPPADPDAPDEREALTLSDQMREIEREEEPERWDGMS